MNLEYWKIQGNKYVSEQLYAGNNGRKGGGSYFNLNILSEYLSNVNMKINMDKTKSMIIAKGNNTHTIKLNVGKLEGN